MTGSNLPTSFRDQPNEVKLQLEVLDKEGRLFRNEKDGSILIRIPEGEFIAGGSGLDEGSGEFSVHLPAYYLAIYPVTNKQYKLFVDETGHRPPEYTKRLESDIGDPVWNDNEYPSEKSNHPVVCVNWYDAKTYCEWAELHLPSELEWEKGARGTGGQNYPWGKEWDSSLCCNKENSGNKGTSEVWDYPTGISPWGLYNMSGNVFEWNMDFYANGAYYRYKKGDIVVPGYGNRRVVRGGAWNIKNPGAFGGCYRVAIDPIDRGSNVGFRCAMPIL